MKLKQIIIIILLLTLFSGCEYLFHYPYGNKLSLELDSRNLNDVFAEDFDNYDVRIRLLSAEKNFSPLNSLTDKHFIVILIKNKVLLVLDKNLEIVLKEDSSNFKYEERSFEGNLLAYNPYTKRFYVGESQYNNDWSYYGFNRLPLPGESALSYMVPEADGAVMYTQSLVNDPSYPHANYIGIFDDPNDRGYIKAADQKTNSYASSMTRTLAFSDLEYITARSYGLGIYLFYWSTVENAVFVEFVDGTLLEWGQGNVADKADNTFFIRDINEKPYKDDVFVINDSIYIKSYDRYQCFSLDGSIKSEAGIPARSNEFIVVQDVNDNQVMTFDSLNNVPATRMQKAAYFYTFDTESKRLSKNKLWF